MGKASEHEHNGTGRACRVTTGGSGAGGRG